MNEYTIYCTEKQTKKALELGAPINIRCSYNGYHPLSFVKEMIVEPHHFAEVPTAEQMIGWLEDGKIKKIRINSISYEDHEEWFYSVFSIDNTDISFNRNYSSRPQATLAAIDAALEYLQDNNE